MYENMQSLALILKTDMVQIFSTKSSLRFRMFAPNVDILWGLRYDYVLMIWSGNQNAPSCIRKYTFTIFRCYR